MSIFTDQHLFVHIPKTAGASIIRTIKSQKKIRQVPNNRTVYNNYHSTAEDCITYISNIDNLFKFTIVRNPWDRATSWFFFRKGIIEKYINKPGKKLINYKSLLLEELTLMEKGFNYWLSIYYNQPWDFTWFSLLHDQYTWLDKIQFDLIIKYENLNTEINNIPNLDFGQLPNRHKSINSNIDYRTLYTTESIDIIDKVYSRDIYKFGYSFE